MTAQPISASIAVLPFVNRSADPENEYFSDGITEEIINALTKIKGLKVTARTSAFAYKNKPADIREIGRRLGVANLLEGSVRKSGNKVRITAQLVNAEDGAHLWAHRFDRQLADIFELQDEISLLIADQIREHYGHFEMQDHLVQAPTQNIKAYDLYLKARHNHLKWDNEGITNAIQYYQDCIAIDPNFALPYFGISYCFAMRASFSGIPGLLDTAEHYLQRGFELDQHSDLGHFSQGTLLFWGRWDFKGGAAAYLKALAINPSNTEAEEGLTELYTAIGYFDLAKEHAQHILTLNPLSPNHHFTLANIRYLTGDYEAALAAAEAALQIAPNFTHAIGLKQLCLILLNRPKTLEAFLQSNRLVECPEECRALYQLLHGQIDKSDVARLIQTPKSGRDIHLFSWDLFLQTHSEDTASALDHLQGMTSRHLGQYVNFAHIPFLKPLHSTPVFKQLLQESFAPNCLPPATEGGKPEPAGSRSLIDDVEIPALLTQLQQLMETEGAYQNADLSLRQLAERLSLTANKLSWLLNEHVGQNFNAYINAFRLKQFQRLALDPANSHLTLLGLAYESGFNSKTVFNAYCKKSTGMTPRAWVKKQQQA
jgi:TolB-like protein/AraC-like DNA-binding protein